MIAHIKGNYGVSTNVGVLRQGILWHVTQIPSSGLSSHPPQLLVVLVADSSQPSAPLGFAFC